MAANEYTPERRDQLAAFIDQLGNKPWIAEAAQMLRESMPVETAQWAIEHFGMDDIGTRLVAEEMQRWSRPRV